VRDVSTIEALAARDKEFGGDHLFGGKNLATNAEGFVFPGAIDPRPLDCKGGVANASYEVDKIVAAASLGQPDGILDIGFETFLHEDLEGPRHGVWRRDQIEILGGSPDTGVVMEREASADSKGDIGL
jgi:hypothetical protein